MRLLSVLAASVMIFSSINAFATNPIYNTEKSKTSKKEELESSRISKNFHSIKKWKMTIEYVNGDLISKTIEVRENSDLSALETAFIEAENHLDTLENIKGYSIAPIFNNAYVLLAHEE